MVFGPEDVRELGIFKHWRTIKKFMCVKYNLSDSDFDLLIYLDAEKRFSRDVFNRGTHTYAWDKKRWGRLREDGWIDVFRNGNRKAKEKNIYRVSTKGQQMISYAFRVALGKEDLP